MVSLVICLPNPSNIGSDVDTRFLYDVDTQSCAVIRIFFYRVDDIIRLSFAHFLARFLNTIISA